MHVEPESDYYRRLLRGILHRTEISMERNRCARAWYTDELQNIAERCQEALKRPRSNGIVIDRMERAAGDLQSCKLDNDVLTAQIRGSVIALKLKSEHIEVLTKRLKDAERNLGPVERSAHRKLAPVLRWLDRRLKGPRTP